MIKNQEGKKVPQVSFKARKDGDWNVIGYDDIFKGKKVIIFALPGAYTPTCSSTHLPRYEELAPVLFEQGIDAVYCLSVNDGFVMEAWAKNQRLSHVQVLPDGNGEFSEALETLVDKEDLGFGKRSWRYSMLVSDGTIEKMFVEPDKPGDPFEVSDADTMLNYLNPSAKLPAEVTIFSKPGCPFCLDAKKLLTEKGFQYEEILLENGVSYKTLRNITGQATAPQIYINREHINGLDGLKKYLET